MSILQAIMLGVLQGLTEFLPVSSSGHLALAESFFAIDSPGVTFEVFVHFGTALAVIVYFRKRIAQVLRAVALWALRRDHEREDARLGLMLLVGTLPAAAVGVFVAESVERAFDNPVLVSALLIVTGVVLWVTRYIPSGGNRRTGAGGALLIGLAQAAAVLPGISRSGATISAALGLKLERSAAAEFAFLLSLPVILGATAMSVGDALAAGSEAGAATAVGTAAAFGSALPAIAVLMRVVSAGTFYRFAYYCWGAGLAALAVTVARLA
ncbi:MAG: UDP-diphosphatase [Candidatus Eisenbacteria bacterium]|nr:UDP-diphosphatase [Candidatus Eisenbacteria bacterium]